MKAIPWYQSKTTWTALTLIAGGLANLFPAFGTWFANGHTMAGAMSVLWPALVTFAGVLVAVFRRSTATVIEGGAADTHATSARGPQ